MPSEQFLIETGIDRLVKLVKESRKVSLHEAAKKLGVSLQIINEWANFLEEEGVIRIHYVFTMPYLELKNMPVTDIAKKETEITNKKVIVEKRIGIASDSIEQNTEFVVSLRKDL